jgi:hypothetical protein
MSYIRNHLVPKAVFSGRFSETLSMGFRLALDTTYDIISETPEPEIAGDNHNTGRGNSGTE